MIFFGKLRAMIEMSNIFSLSAWLSIYYIPSLRHLLPSSDILDDSGWVNKKQHAYYAAYFIINRLATEK